VRACHQKRLKRRNTSWLRYSRGRGGAVGVRGYRCGSQGRGGGR
jgi:hypothetical protein